MKRVAITTLGCKTNQFESAAMAESLGREGFRVVAFEEEADVYVINTCTVTARTDAESRKLIRRAGRRNPSARVVVTGCYAQLGAEELRKLPQVSLVIGNTEKREIAALLRDMGESQRVLVGDIAEETAAQGLELQSFAEHTRAFLQIQNGCDAFCAYCIVPHARGRSRSVVRQQVLAGIESFAARGFREVVLTGIHLGGYGLDLDPPDTLLDLLAEADRRRLVPRLRVGSVEPTEIGGGLIRFLSDAATVCPHLHIPLQSGSDSVLERMNRTCTTSRFREVVEDLAAAVPGVCVGADLIAGFPGETREEFEEGLEFVSSLPLSYLHVFPFSPRAGTPAATMPDQVAPAEVARRARLLRELSQRKKEAFFRSFIGKELRVLVQGKGDAGRVRGLSRNYIVVEVAGCDAAANSEITVRVTGAGRDVVRAEPLKTESKGEAGHPRS